MPVSVEFSYGSTKAYLHKELINGYGLSWATQEVTSSLFFSEFPELVDYNSEETTTSQCDFFKYLKKGFRRIRRVACGIAADGGGSVVSGVFQTWAIIWALNL